MNFAWYLNIWINVLHNDEAVFWRTMTPARCVALYREFFKLMGAPGRRVVSESPAETEKAARLSLSAYLMGGGG